MLRLEEIQFINWGPLRTDAVPFMTHDINLVTGSNGSAKTCFVNGIKVLLGVSLPKGSEAREWIFNPVALADIDENMTAAEQAWLRGTFCNPRVRGGHRFFAWEGDEFEVAEHATVVCVVRRDSIRYRILPGRVQWQEPIAASLSRFQEEHPLAGVRWKGPRIYDDALSRMGVSRAMRGVLALPQGETGELLNESPSGLLRKILQLTGKQSIIDAYTEERKKFEQAEVKFKETSRSLEMERLALDRLDRDAQRYLEWRSDQVEYERLRDVFVPAAAYRDAVRLRDSRANDLEGLEETISNKDAELAGKRDQLPVCSAELQRRQSERSDLMRRRDTAARGLRRVDRIVTRVQADAEQAAASRQHAVALVAGRSADQLEAERGLAGREWRRCNRAQELVDQEVEALATEAAALRAGRAAAPAAVLQFRDRLAAIGVDSTLLADVLEPADTPARQIEAALGDAVWALVVSAADFGRAVRAARDEEYGYPIARAGSGHPVAVLAGVHGPDHLAALLVDLDVPAARDVGVDDYGIRGAGADGFFHLPSLAQLRAPAAPRIGAQARAARLAEIERRLPRVEEERRITAGAATAAAARLRELDEALGLLVQMAALGTEVRRLHTHLERARDVQARMGVLQAERTARVDELGPVVGQLETTVSQLRDQIDVAEAQLVSLRSQVTARQAAVIAAEESIQLLAPTPEQLEAASDEQLGSSDDLRSQSEKAERRANDEGRYPRDIRSESVLGQREDQRETVSRADEALGGVGRDMEALRRHMDRAREAYDDNVNATISALNTKFREVCESAGVVGELRRVAGDGRGEYGLDVLAAHKRGERPLSYQKRNFHSGGQTVKIAILLLLSAMSMGDEGSAEMLIMDEPIAHMSAENADQIAQVIVDLKDKAQFILAMPTNAETLRVHWAAWQIALLSRRPGEPRSESAQIMTSLTVDLEARFRPPQLALRTA